MTSLAIAPIVGGLIAASGLVGLLLQRWLAERHTTERARDMIGGIAPSRRHRGGIAVRFRRMLRWRRDKPVAGADTLQALRAPLPTDRDC